jgi:hypothetical protein
MEVERGRGGWVMVGLGGGEMVVGSWRVVEAFNHSGILNLCTVCGSCFWYIQTVRTLCLRLQVNVHVHVFVFAYVYVCTYIHTYIHTYIRIHTYT